MMSISSLATTCGTTLLNTFKVSSGALAATFVNPVRYRHFEDKDRFISKRRWGKEDKLEVRGLLPRIETSKKLPGSEYVPKNHWSEKRALFGQNDYIDILGEDETISPIKFAYGIPSWLRGFNGKEYHMLLRKRAFMGPKLAAAYPQTNHFLKKRLKYLYRYMNAHNKHHMDKKVMRR